MPSTYRSFLTLNMDEAVVAGKVRDFFKGDVEVFVPLNAQLKDIDLVAYNLKNKKAATLQVKGSRAYEPSAMGRDFDNGSAGWFSLDKEKTEGSTADFFVFLVNVIAELERSVRRNLESHFITVRTATFKELCKQYKPPKPRYDFYIWVNPRSKLAFDFRDEKKKGRMWLTDYLDDRGLAQVGKALS